MAELSDSQVIDQRLVLLRRRWRFPPCASAGPAREVTACPCMCVAISREAGAPGGEVAQAIGRRLEWPVYDRELIDLIAKESHLRAELLSSLDERDPGWLLESISSFGDPTELSATGYAYYLKRVLMALSKQGHAVIVGRGAATVLPAQQTVRVRLIADFDERVQRIGELHGLTEKEARREMQTMERRRSEFVAHHFHGNVQDAHSFDLTLNASWLSVEACAELAVQTLRIREASRRPQAAAV